MSFFVKACVIGLKNYPAINAEIQGEEIVYKNYYNISIAVGTDQRFSGSSSKRNR